MGILTRRVNPGLAHPNSQTEGSPEGAPQLKGLILCGGKSRRMQTDKSLLEYHAVPHWQYVMSLLAPFAEETWLSCREQQRHRYGAAPVLPDDPQIGISGPAAGILAAHRRFPRAAWLVIACDLPLVTAASIRALLAARNPEHKATAVMNPEQGWPEPLLAIWEPAGLTVLERWVSAGRNYPRQVLDQCKPLLVNLPRPAELFNANTPAEKAIAEKTITENAIAAKSAGQSTTTPHRQLKTRK